MRRMALNLHNSSKHFILGAGKIGDRLYKLLLGCGIDKNRIVVWDSNPARVKWFENKDIISGLPKPEDIDPLVIADACLYITVFAHEVSAELYDRYKDAGFSDIFYKRSYFSELFINECSLKESLDLEPHSLFTCFTCPSRRAGESASCQIFDKRYGPSRISSNESLLTIDTVGLLVTTSCNLTCVGCNHLRDHFEPSHNQTFATEDILSSLANLLASVDFVRSLVIVGGESLLHPDLSTIIEECKRYNNIGYIQIITNGGLVPLDPNLYSVLSDKRIIVEVSGYGDALSERSIAYRSELLRNLKSHNIMFRYDEAASWIDFGGFEHRRYDSRKLQEVYNNCCFVSNDILNGRLYKCSRSAYGHHTSLIPTSSSDYVDLQHLAELPLSQRRKIMSKYLAMIPSACQHCDGTNPRLIPAGIQVARPAKVK